MPGFLFRVRLLLGTLFITTGWTKLTIDFTSDPRLLWFSPGGWDIFRAFQSMGHYWHFIGLSQIAAGLLLITKRYATLGALMLLPITVNIFMLSVFTDFPWYTLVLTGVCLLLNITLLWADFPKWRGVLAP